jgi:pyruvate dehydrogenase E1 component alpha subunit
MGTSVERTANHTDIWKLGLGYEMPCGPVDGMNPVKVAEAMTELLKEQDVETDQHFLKPTVTEDIPCLMLNIRSKEVEEYKKLILLLKF